MLVLALPGQLGCLAPEVLLPVGNGEDGHNGEADQHVHEGAHDGLPQLPRYERRSLAAQLLHLFPAQCRLLFSRLCSTISRIGYEQATRPKVTRLKEKRKDVQARKKGQSSAWQDTR